MVKWFKKVGNAIKDLAEKTKRAAEDAANQARRAAEEAANQARRRAEEAANQARRGAEEAANPARRALNRIRAEADRKRREEEERRRKEEERRRQEEERKRIEAENIYIAHLQRLVNAITKKRDDLNSQISYWQKDLNTTNNTIASSELKIRLLTDNIKDMQITTNVLDTSYNILIASTDHKIQVMDGIKETFTGIREGLTSERNINKLEKQIKDGNAELPGLSKKLATLKTDCTNARKTVSTLTAQVQTLTEQLSKFADIHTNLKKVYNNGLNVEKIAQDRIKGVPENFQDMYTSFQEGYEGIAQAMIDLKILNAQGKLDMYKTVLAQNNTLLQQKQTMQNTYTTDNQKVNYIQEKLDSTSNIWVYMMIVYYLIVLISVYFLYVSVTMSRPIKIIIFLAFVAYPWVIYMLEEWLYFGLVYFSSIVMGNVFQKTTDLAKSD